MRHGFFLSLSAAALLSVASLVAARPASPGHAQISCSAPPGWQEVLHQNPRFVVFGEVHGTEQPPQLVGQLVCAEALKGKRVLLAVEMGANRDEALQAAWQLPSGQFAQALAKLDWVGRQDGVGSKAMFDLIVRMHLLNERGLPVSTTAFSGAKNKQQYEKFASLPAQGGHEAAQAENIANAATTGTPDLVIVLVGNLHARKVPVERGGAFYDPMAKRLSTYGNVVSLDMRYGAGASWSCQLKQGFKPSPGQRVGPENIQCGPFPTPGHTKGKDPVRIELSASDPTTSAEGYDGTYWVGPVTASPPAFR